MVVEPFGLPSHSFERESQTLGDGAAAVILRRAMNDHAMQVKVPESMIYQHATGRCHNAPALMRGGQPVAHGGGSVGPVNAVMANHAAETILKANDDLEGAVVGT